MNLIKGNDDNAYVYVSSDEGSCVEPGFDIHGSGFAGDGSRLSDGVVTTDAGEGLRSCSMLGEN